LALAFSCFAILNIVLSLSLVAPSFGMPYLVPVPPYLQLAAWVVSGNLFAWVSLVAAGSEARWMLCSAILALVGSVLQVLPVMLPKHEALPTLSWLGGAVMSCTVLAGTLMYLRDPSVFSISSVTAAKLLLTFFLALAIPSQVWSLVTVSPLTGLPRVHPRFGASVVFVRALQTLFPLTVASFALLATEWLWLPVVSKVATGRQRNRARHCSVTSDRGKKKVFPLCWKLVVGLSLLLGVLVSGYRWSEGYRLGSDADYYHLVLLDMNATGIQGALSTERPFFFLVLYSVQKILGLGPLLLLQLVPIVLAVVLVASTYLFTRSVGWSEKTAALAAVFASVSPHITAGVEYYIIASWLGIPLMMLFSYGFLRSVEKRSIQWTLLTIALSSLMLGLHYLTWLFTILVLIVYFLLNIVEKRPACGLDRVFCLGVILSCAAVVVPALLIAHLVGGSLLVGLRLVQNMIDMFLTYATPMNFLTLLMNREGLSDYFAWRHYAIPLLYVLALVGFAKFAGSTSERVRLLRSWVIASCLGLLVVRIDELWRFLYIMPLEILTALGLCVILERAQLIWGFRSTVRESLAPIAILLSVFITLGLLLALSPLPPSLIFLSLVAVILVELRWPSDERWCGMVCLFVVSLVLEELGRALCAFAKFGS